MNRRQFNLSLLGAASAPLLPVLPALPAKAAATALASPLDPAKMYTPWAVRYARVHGACSAQKLASAFQITPDVAQALMARLQVNGIIAAPGVGGLAKALDPISFDLQYVGRSAAAQATSQAPTQTTAQPKAQNPRLAPDTDEQPTEGITEKITEKPAEIPTEEATTEPTPDPDLFLVETTLAEGKIP